MGYRHDHQGLPPTRASVGSVSRIKRPQHTHTHPHMTDEHFTARQRRALRNASGKQRDNLRTLFQSQHASKEESKPAVRRHMRRSRRETTLPPEMVHRKHLQTLAAFVNDHPFAPVAAHMPVPEVEPRSYPLMYRQTKDIGLADFIDPIKLSYPTVDVDSIVPESIVMASTPTSLEQVACAVLLFRAKTTDPVLPSFQDTCTIVWGQEGASAYFGAREWRPYLAAMQVRYTGSAVNAGGTFYGSKSRSRVPFPAVAGASTMLPADFVGLAKTIQNNAQVLDTATASLTDHCTSVATAPVDYPRAKQFVQTSSLNNGPDEFLGTISNSTNEAPIHEIILCLFEKLPQDFSVHTKTIVRHEARFEEGNVFTYSSTPNQPTPGGTTAKGNPTVETVEQENSMTQRIMDVLENAASYLPTHDRIIEATKQVSDMQRTVAAVSSLGASVGRAQALRNG